jgi:hypothetical protein
MVSTYRLCRTISVTSLIGARLLMDTVARLDRPHHRGRSGDFDESGLPPNMRGSPPLSLMLSVGVPTVRLARAGLLDGSVTVSRLV